MGNGLFFIFNTHSHYLPALRLACDNNNINIMIYWTVGFPCCYYYYYHHHNAVALLRLGRIRVHAVVHRGKWVFY